MRISIRKANKDQSPIVQNLARFYAYDLYKYCGLPLNWEVPSNGLFEALDFSVYWKEENRHPFLIFVDQELAGFVLVHKIGSLKEIDWVIGEFFVISKYQGRGVGTLVAKKVFDHFRGVWEVMQIPENKGAVIFWEKMINQYTKGQFKKEEKIIQEPKPHPMIVLTFTS